jgi:small subunit ribosomal protein S5
MAPEMLEDSQGTLESTTISIYRTAATVKGGRRFSFGALVAVGDRHGSVGLGYGKAPGVPAAIEKAQKEAKKKLKRVILNKGTLPHEITGKFCASEVRLIPASPGTGVIAGGTVRAVLELAGVRDCLTKAYGSTNQKNLAKAAMEGLVRLQSRDKIADLRGVQIIKTTVDEKIELGEKYAPSASGESSGKAKAPVNVKDEQARKGGRGKGRGGKGGGGGRGRGRRRGGEQRPGQIGEPSVVEAAETPADNAAETPPSPPASGPSEPSAGE